MLVVGASPLFATLALACSLAALIVVTLCLYLYGEGTCRDITNFIEVEQSSKNKPKKGRKGYIIPILLGDSVFGIVG